MTKAHLCDVPTLGDALDELNDLNAKIISVIYATDSNQIVIFYEEKEPEPITPIKSIFGRLNEET